MDKKKIEIDGQVWTEEKVIDLLFDLCEAHKLDVREYMALRIINRTAFAEPEARTCKWVYDATRDFYSTECGSGAHWGRTFCPDCGGAIVKDTAGRVFSVHTPQEGE